VLAAQTRARAHSVTESLIEGTTPNLRVGVQLPDTLMTVVLLPALSTVQRRGCGQHTSTIAMPTASVLQYTYNNVPTAFAVFSFGDYVNPWDQTCGSGPNTNDNPVLNADDQVVVRIALRVVFNATGTGIWSDQQVLQLFPAMIYDVYNPANLGAPRPGVEPTAPNAPYSSLQLVVANLVLVGSTPLNVIVHEPELAAARTSALAATPTVVQTQFREGEQIQVCTQVTHTGTSDACAHELNFNINFGGPTPTSTMCLLLGDGTTAFNAPAVTGGNGSPIGTCTTSGCTQPSINCVMSCPGALWLGDTLTECTTVRLVCPTPPPSPTPPPPTPPPSQCFPLTLTWDSAPGGAAAGARVQSLPAPYCVTVTPRVMLGNFVWVDANRNGVQDIGELGIQSANVSLFTTTGALIQWTLTDNNGIYMFDSSSAAIPQTGPLSIQPQSTYIIRVALPNTSQYTGYTVTTYGNNNANTTNSDAQAIGPTGAEVDGVVTGTDGTYFDFYDIGYQPPLTGSSIGHFVWLDLNGNGLQDAGEPVSVLSSSSLLLCVCVCVVV
jgi:hypothetical protein